IHGPATPPAPWGCWAGAAVAFLYLPRQLGWTRFPSMLQSTRQVPREWAYDYPRWATALLFGLALGSGCYTRIVTPTFSLLFAWPFLAAGFVCPLVIWGSYGLARSWLVWWLACSAPVGNPSPHTSKLIGALMRNREWMRRANAVLLLSVAVWLVT